MADKRRYYDRDSREKEAANSCSSSEGGSVCRNNNVSFRGGGGGSGNVGESNYDEPPNSRLFILCGRNISEDELRASFEKFGVIRELWIVKEKNSGDSKGVAYIKFGKTSEAAVAMEEMNGKFLGNNAKSLKVLIANSRDQGSRRDVNEEERLLRLFVIVPKAMSEVELKEHFSLFGDVEHCNIVRDRNTKESKGYAYVKFHRVSHAAKAFEGCDRSFKPVFADPRPQKQFTEDRYSGSHTSAQGPYDMNDYSLPEPPYSGLMHHHEQHHQLQHAPQSLVQAPSRISIIANGNLNQDQLWRLCDFFPGLDYCNARYDPKTRQCYASALYNSPQAALFAKEKLHGFEYPPGQRLIVKLDPDCIRNNSHSGGQSLLGHAHAVPGRYSVNHNGNSSVQIPSPGGGRMGTNIPPDLASLAETLAHATSIIQAAGLNSQQPHLNLHSGSGNQTQGEYDPSYCSVKLPPPQPLAPMDSPIMERLFVVCHPSPPPSYALKDIFGRFGNLIDIFMLNGKNFGYAKYANKVSADDARETLHAQEICGVRLKVFPAEPQEKSSVNHRPSGDQKCKRPKMESTIDGPAN